MIENQDENQDENQTLKRYILEKTHCTSSFDNVTNDDSSILQLHRTDSLIIVEHNGTMRTVPSPRKLQDVADALLYNFRIKLALSTRLRLMCRCLTFGLKNRIGDQCHGALTDVMESHLGEDHRTSLMWVIKHPMKARKQIQEVLLQLSLTNP